MCGRFACALDPQTVCRSCQYQSPNGALQEPKWRDNPRLPEYRPSTNVAPTNYSPVLVSKRALTGDGEEGDDRVVEPMRFGLIPSWHKGEESSMQFSTINCRAEGILEKPTFAVPLKKGRRCVVLAEGFYEWDKHDKNAKQPYLIYLPEGKEHFFSPKTESDAVHGAVPLLKLAAVFDVWKPKDEEEPVYSYSIITTSASNSLRWIHDRMPAILQTEDDVTKWLDSANLPVQEALHVIHSVDGLTFHPVTRAMGNATYKDPDAVKPISLEAGAQIGSTGKPLPKGQQTLTSFFQSKTKHSPEDNFDDRPAKVKKT